MDLLKLKATLGLDTTEYNEGLVGAESKAKSMGGKIAGGMATAAKAGAVAVAAVGTATVAAGAAITHATGKVAEYGDNIDKMSQKMGLSAEKYQEWDAILQHSGTSIEAMKPSMKTLAVAAESGSDAFQKLGMSQQEVANMSQEELFEKTISALQNVGDDTERTYLASKLLGRGATELGALLNTSAEDTEKMRQRVHELGGVMSDEAVKASAAYQDSLQDLHTAMDGIKRNAIAEFLPGMTKVMDGLTNIIAGEKGGKKKIEDGLNSLIEKVEEVAPKFAKAMGQVFSAIFKAVIENMPKITNELTSFLMSSINGLVDALPDLAQAAIQILVGIVNAVIDAIPGLLTSLGEFIRDGFPILLEKIMEGIESLLDALVIDDKMEQAGSSFVEDMLAGIEKSTGILIEHAPVIIGKFVEALVKNFPKIIMAGMQMQGALVEGLIKGIVQIPGAVAQAVAEIIEGFLGPNWQNIGEDILMGIIQGIVNKVTDLANAVVGAARTAYNKARGFLQSNSPSKLFRDKVGATIGEGMAMGISDTIPMVVDTMNAMDDSIIEPYDDVGAYYAGPGGEDVWDTVNSGSVITSVNSGAAPRDITVVLQLDETQLAKTVFRLNSEESQRVGVSLGGVST